MTINKERIEMWAAALESGEYEQCKGALRIKEGGVIDWINGKSLRHLALAERDYHCAEGVAIEVALKNGLFRDHPNAPDDDLVYKTSGGLLPACVSTWYGFDPEVCDPTLEEASVDVTVSTANDAGFTFWDIAQMLRQRYLKEDIDVSE